MAKVTNFKGLSDMDLAKRVMSGEFGNGEERKATLGDRYSSVQSLINNGMKAPVETMDLDTPTSPVANIKPPEVEVINDLDPALSASGATENQSNKQKESEILKVIEQINQEQNNTNNANSNNTSNINNNNKPNLKELYKYFHDRKNGTIQGFTTTDKYYVMIQTDEENHKGKLIFTDKKTGEQFTMNYNQDFGHANDMAYNPKKNELVIPYKESGTGKYAMKIINLNEKNEKGNFKATTKYTPFYTGKIAYDKKENAYYIIQGNSNDKNTGVIRKIDADTFKVDEKFGKKEFIKEHKFGFEHGYLSQGIAVHNDKIYMIAENIKTWDTEIIEYDKAGGKKNKKFTIPGSEMLGELKSIAFDKNGQLYGNIATKEENKTDRHVRIARIFVENSSQNNNNSSNA